MSCSNSVWLFSVVNTRHYLVSESIIILCWKSSFEAILCEMQWSYFPMQRRARQSTLGTRAERSVEARLQENVRPCDDKGWQSRLCIFSWEWRPAMPAERGSSLFSYVFSVFFEYLQTKFLRDMIKFNVVFPRANLINIIKESGSGRGAKRPRFML